MSHTMNIETEIRDIRALESACRRLELDLDKTVAPRRLHDNVHEGMAVKLKDWRYPLIIQEEGRIKYDNYNGHWGHMDRLGELKAHYGMEKAKTEARKKGYAAFETVDNETGNLKLKIRMKMNGQKKRNGSHDHAGF